MTDRRQYLLDLANRNVQAYIALPQTRAALLSGSVAEGLCDEYSDCDISLYYEALPSEDDLRRARLQNGGSKRLWLSGERSEGGFAESYRVNGVECQFGHVTLVQWETDIARMLAGTDLQTPLIKALSGTLIGIPLYGEPLIRRWQTQIAAYPDSFAEAMVQHYLKFFALWAVQDKLARRDITIWYYQILVESAQNLLGVLSGLNRLYYSPFQFKRMHRFVAQMSIAPADLATRLEALFQAEPAAAALQLEALVQETVTLVETHMPQIDTAATKHRLGERQKPWQFSQN